VSIVLGREATPGLLFSVTDLRSPLAAERVTNLAILDIVPTGDAFSQVTMAFALDFRVWSFLVAPYELPERRQ
jgi:hypothetical protein